VHKLTAALAVLLLVSCTDPYRNQDDGLRILVSILPQRYFAERIAGDRAQVSVLIPPGANPAAYELSPSEMRFVAEADVWFSIGVPAEHRWLDDFPSINPGLLIVDTAGGIERLPIERYGLTEAEHDNGSEDPHIWLSPELVRSQVNLMAETLAGIDTLNAGFYSANLNIFNMSIDSLQRDMHALLDPLAGTSFLVFHPAWGYFSDEFHLVQVPIEIAGSEPSPGEMALIVDLAGEAGIRTVFVSPQFSTSSAEAIAGELHAEVTVIDPLAEDWHQNMRRVAAAVAGSRK